MTKTTARAAMNALTLGAITIGLFGCSSMISPDTDRLGGGMDGGTSSADGGADGGVVIGVDTGPTGMCTGGMIRCGSACVDPVADRMNCGGCGRSCASSESCLAGVCSCPAGDPACGVVGNPDRCGASAQTCSSVQVCTGGVCACRPGLTDIGGGNCVDLVTDPNNCGAPGVRCDGATPFCAGGGCHGGCPDALMRCDGACVDFRNDVLNCGGCGNGCARDQVCVAGDCRDYRAAATCASCTGDFATCCDYAAGQICVDSGRCPAP